MGGWVEECMRQGGEIEGALRIYLRGGREAGRRDEGWREEEQAGCISNYGKRDGGMRVEG